MPETPAQKVVEAYKFPFVLRKDQDDCINQLSSWSRGKCFMDVGLGKTAVATAVAFYWGLIGEIDQVIVLMPPILIPQWEVWFRTFPVSVTVYQGTPAQRKKLSLDSDVIISTLGLFKNDFKRFMIEFQHKKVVLIVDEAAAIRRVSTLNFKAVRDFTEARAEKLLLLTGTAINNPVHAYGYVKLVTPEVYRSYDQFCLLHVARVDIFKTAVEFKRLDLLSSNLMLQAVRVQAEDVLNLPEVTYSNIEYDLGPEQRQLYNKIVEELLVELDDGEVIDALTPQKLYVQAQRILLRPVELGGKKIEPTALALIDNMLEESGMLSGGADKLLIFCNYIDSNNVVIEYLTHRFPEMGAVLAYGPNGAKKNAKNVASFLNDDGVKVLVGNPLSIGVGLNLQSVCRLILFLELPTTSNTFTQALGRIKRSGQTKNCLVRMAIARGTIQTQIRRNIVKKEEAVQEVMPTKETLRRALYGA